MKFITLIHLACKYLWRYKRRYLFLFFALSFGFSIVTLITSIKDDMDENVYLSAQAHYAGDIITIGYERSQYHLTEREVNAVLKSTDEMRINPIHIVRRTMFGERGMLYVNGAAIRLKYIHGVDWTAEASYFTNLDYESPFDLDSAGDDAIALSAPIAKFLGLKIGDEVTLEVDTRQGHKNTGTFVVKGIINDASIFGYYKAYISRLSLNRMLLFDDEDCSMIGLYIDDRTETEQKRKELHNSLSQKILTGSLVKNRDELLSATRQNWEGIEVFVITLPVYLSEVANLLDAMNMVSYILYGMMLLIILVSAMVTYRLVLHERSRELGTMRTLGFQEGDVRFILITESAGLILLSIVGGLALSLLLSWGISFISFSWFPSFEIFLKNGKLHTLYAPKTLIRNIIAIMGMMGIAVFSPIYHTSRQSLTRLLSGGDS